MGGVSNRSCDEWCALYNTMFEVTASFAKQEGGASFASVQRAVACGVNEKMVRVHLLEDGMLSAMRFCVAEDATSIETPENT